MTLIKKTALASLLALASLTTAHAYTITGQIIPPGTIPFTLESVPTPISGSQVYDTAFTTIDGLERISYSGMGKSGIYVGTTSGVAVSPFGSNSMTPYLAVEPNDALTITYATPQTTLDLLWGSVDDYNDITLNIGTIAISGATIMAHVSGITSGISNVAIEIGNLPAFTSITLTSNNAAFEFVPGTPVPEPASMALLGMGMIGTGVMARRRRQSTTTPTAC